MNIYSLYQEIEKELVYEYSLQKYGDISSLDKYASTLVNLILKKVHGKKNVLYVGIKYPCSNSYKKNSVLLTKRIAQEIKLPIVYAFYHYKYDKNNFYDNQQKRKVHQPKVSDIDCIKYKDWNFIVIEDSIITGNTLKAIENSLIGISTMIDVFAILDLRGKIVKEEKLNNDFFENKEVNGLIKIASTRDFIPTTQFLRTYGDLSEEDKSKLIKSIKHGECIECAFNDYSN